MPTFQYQAVDAAGKRLKGFIEADNQARAQFLLTERGLTPIRLGSMREGGGLRELLSPTRLLRALFDHDRIRLGESFYYLAAMIGGGSSLTQALETLGRMSGSSGGRIWLGIRDDVAEGKSFSQALAARPAHFPEVYAGMTGVAENVGKLPQVLERIAEHEERRADLGGRLISALIYPAIITLVGLGAGYFMLTGILPKTAAILTASKKALPLKTQILLSLGTFLGHWGIPLFILLCAALLVAIAAHRRNPLPLDRLLWHVPLVRKAILARFASLLGFQLEAGIPLVPAMRGAAKAIRSTHFRAIIAQATQEVAAGDALDSVLARTQAFPDLFVMTIASGRKAGRLGLFLSRLSTILERECDNACKRAVALAEPAMILIVGIGIGFLVLAIMGPIFDLSTIVK